MFSCYGAENPVGCTQIVYSDCEALGVRTNMCILGNRHTKETPSVLAQAPQALILRAAISVDLPGVGSGHAVCFLNEGSCSSLGGPSAIAGGGEYHEGA